MRTKRFIIDLAKFGLKKDSSWNHEMLTDIHAGHANFAEDRYLEAVKRIAEQDNRSTHFNGDNIEDIPPRDKRFSQSQVNLKYLESTQQTKYFHDMTMPIYKKHKEFLHKFKDPVTGELIQSGGKIAGHIMGNHEWVYYTPIAFEAGFCHPIVDGRQMDIDFLGYAAFIHFEFYWKAEHLRTFVALVSHGSYGGFQMGGDVNTMTRAPARFDADIFLEGHSHDKWIHITEVQGSMLTNKGVELVNRQKCFGNGGTFQRSFVHGNENYNEKMLFNSRVSRIGTITVEMFPYEGKMRGHL